MRKYLFSLMLCLAMWTPGCSLIQISDAAQSAGAAASAVAKSATEGSLEKMGKAIDNLQQSTGTQVTGTPQAEEAARKADTVASVADKVSSVAGVISAIPGPQQPITGAVAGIATAIAALATAFGTLARRKSQATERALDTALVAGNGVDGYGQAVTHLAASRGADTASLIANRYEASGAKAADS